MVTQSAAYGEECFHYQVCFVSTRKDKVAIHVHPDGSVRVDVPEQADLAVVKQAVMKKALWVLGHIKKAREQREHVLPREYVSGESYFYLGRRYVLKVSKATKGAAAVKLTRGQFVVNTPDASPEAVKAALCGWYLEHARSYLGDRLAVVCGRVPWVPTVPQWRLRTMRKQWGSCSPKGGLSLNQHLVKAPRECIDYVLLHELCHLKEHNHGKGFYKLLAEHLPEWKSTKAKLDGMAEMLLNE